MTGIVDNTASSNVGIGTASPNAKLDINGALIVSGNANLPGQTAALVMQTTGATGRIYVGDGTGWDLRFSKRVASTDTDFVTLKDTGHVGVGTATPEVKLDVADGDMQTNQYVRIASWPEYGTGYGRLWYDGADGLGNGTGYLSIGDDTGNGKLVIQRTSGNVGIGTTNPSHKLAVNGTIKAREVILELTGWSDYVFAADYRLAPLSEVEAHIRDRKHLPGIPSAAEVEAGGVSLGDMQARLLAKVEELTLHMIAQEKRIARLEDENNALRSGSLRRSATLSRDSQ